MALLPASVPVLVQRREWEAGHDPAAIKRNGYLPIDYNDPEREVILFDGDHDVFADGSITLMLTPGHTPGHESGSHRRRARARRRRTYFARGLADQRFPVYGDDYKQQARSAARLRALRDAGVRVIPGHDPDVLHPGLITIDQASAD